MQPVKMSVKFEIKFENKKQEKVKRKKGNGNATSEYVEWAKD